MSSEPNVANKADRNIQVVLVFCLKVARLLSSGQIAIACSGSQWPVAEPAYAKTLLTFLHFIKIRGIFLKYFWVVLAVTYVTPYQSACISLLVWLGFFLRLWDIFGFLFVSSYPIFIFFTNRLWNIFFLGKVLLHRVCFPLFFFWLLTENFQHRLLFALSHSHSLVPMASYTSPFLSWCFKTFLYLQIAIKSLASLSSAYDLTEIFILPRSWIASLIPPLKMIWESCNWEHQTDALGLLTPGFQRWYLCSCGSFFSSWPFYCVASS